MKAWRPGWPIDGTGKIFEAEHGQSTVQFAGSGKVENGAMIAREIHDFTAQWSYLRKIVFQKDGLICW